MGKEIVINSKENPQELIESAACLGRLVQQWDLQKFSVYYYYHEGSLETLDAYALIGDTSRRIDTAPGSDRFGRQAEAVVSEINELATQMLDLVNLSEHDYASVSGEISFEGLSGTLQRVTWENEDHQILEIQDPTIFLSPTDRAEFQNLVGKLDASSARIHYTGSAGSVEVTFSFENEKGEAVQVDYACQGYLDLRQAFHIWLTESEIADFQNNEGGYGEIHIHLLRPELNSWKHWDYVQDSDTTNRTFDVFTLPKTLVSEFISIRPEQVDPVWR